MNRIVAAQVRSGFTVWVRFHDGVDGVVDLSNLAGKGIFRAWESRDFFEKAHVGPGGSLAWSDEIELDPDRIYMTVSGTRVDDLFPNLRRQPVDA